MVATLRERRAAHVRERSRAMRALLTQLSVWFVFSAPTLALGGPGDVDPTFVYPRPEVLEPDSTNAVPLADGFLVVKSRDFDRPGSDSTLELTRIDEDGRIVSTFGIDGRAATRLAGATNLSTAVRRLPSGFLLLAGFQLTPGVEPDSVAVLARFDSTGRLDPTFGLSGIAKVDVPGQLDRIGAIDVLADGRILAGVWSRMAKDPYGDCSTDRVSLIRLEPDGTSPEVIYFREKNAFADNGCRNVMTLEVASNQSIFFGSHVEIAVFDSPLPYDARVIRTPTGCCYGPFAVDPRLGAVWTNLFFGGGVLNSTSFPYGFPESTFDSASRLTSIVAGLGFPSRRTVSRIVRDGDPPRWYLGFSTDSGVVGIAKLRTDGSPDSGWAGGKGIVRIDGTGGRDDYAPEGLANDVRLMSLRSGGETLVVVTADGVIERRLARSTPSHGQISFALGWLSVPEATGLAQIGVLRLGGADGAVSVDYNLAISTECVVDVCAQQGADFGNVSGRLEWADGDESVHYISVPIVNDSRRESGELLAIEMRAPSGGAVIVEPSSVVLRIVDDDASTEDSAHGEGPGGGNSGGGAATWPILVFLGVCALVRRRAHAGLTSRRAHRGVVSTGLSPWSVQALVIAVAALGLSGSAYGRAGDMDPGFGNGGVLRVSQLGLPLQDGRLLYQTAGGYGRTDVDGHPDPTFGRQGLQEWPAGFKPGNGFRGSVSPSAWARTRDGGLLAAGTLPNADTPQLAVLSLRSDGSIDAPFGTDGLARVPTSLGPVTPPRWIEQEVVVQPDGRILVLTEVHRNSYDVIEDVELARLLPDGAPDPSFGTGGIVKIAPGTGSEWVVLDALKDGRIRLSGDILIYLAASGAPDAGSAQDDPELGPPARHWAIGEWTADGGVLVTSSESDPRLGTRHYFAKLNADGIVDRSFGRPGSGILEVGTSVTSTWTVVGHACSPDGRFLFLSLSAGPYHHAVARFRTGGPGAGELDPDFGDGGIVDLGRMYWSGSIVGTSDGGLIVSTLYSTLRLFGIDRSSPGFVDFSTSQQVTWRETDSRIEVRVSRLAGTSGTLRVRYSTPAIDPRIQDEPTAKAGVDFEAVAGELVWADGDTADKSFFIPLLTDGSVEPMEMLVVDVSSLTPGAWARYESLYLGLADVSSPVFNGPAAPGSTPTGGRNGGSGGGGAFGFLLAAMLGLLRLLSRRIET
jgi:uncharacterized delta-60 repeat protein